MKAILKGKLLVLAPENELERTDLAGWKADRAGHVLLVGANAGVGLSLVDLGPQARACNEPLNVVSTSADPAARWISNFAPTPFFLEGQTFACVEAFWQGLKFEDEAERARVALLEGRAALRAGRERPYGPTVTYQGREVRVGTAEHWQLMERACRAKFAQNLGAREALLSTGDRPLVHRTRKDSRTIPGAILCDIWMRVRRRLQKQGAG
jgi:predicted NAD-dependent protein-ADP-ribosyltransferase YbiA (DUF1768 family)